MKYILKKTTELSYAERDQLADLFFQVFGIKHNSNYFKAKYKSIVNGYSYHSLMVSEAGLIVGSFTCTPFYYSYFGSKLIFSLAIDTMIHQNFRSDIFSLKRMHDICIDVMRTEGVSFLFAIPNANAYLYWKKIVKWNDIGRLHYYIFPIDLSKLDKKYKLLSYLTKSYAFMNRFTFCLDSTQPSNKPIHKVADNAFIIYRYSQQYRRITKGNKTAYYRIYDENNTRTAYIIDIYPLTRSWLHQTVKDVYLKENNNLDIILYAGCLDFKTYNLFKVPEKYEPIKIMFVGKILNDDKVDNRVFNLSNWRINLSDFDVK